jgi:hypothetical protein
VATKPGTNANAATVANDSAAITLRTALSGRNQVGTKHIGPVPDAASANGVLTGAYLMLLDALAQKLIQSATPAGWGDTIISPVVADLKFGSNELVNSYIIGEQSRVQRRRTVGLGE